MAGKIALTLKERLATAHTQTVSSDFMKKRIYIILTILSLTFASCKDNKTSDDKFQLTKLGWTEEQKWAYFQDSIAHRMYNGRHGAGDSLNDFEVFSRIMFADIKAKNKFDPFIYAFEEPYIDTTKIGANKFWFRITVAPCFRKPYCLIAEKKNNRTYVTAKMTDGDGGYLTGLLDFSTTKTFADTIYNDISKELHELNFWKLDKDTTCSGGFDGESWTFEAIENGRYNIITRWVPLHCGNQVTIQLGKLGVKIRDLSNLLDYAAINHKIEKKELENSYND